MKAPTSSFPSRWRRAFTRTAHGLDVDGLTPAAVAVGLVLSEYADWTTGGAIRPTRQRVALTVGVSVATVGRCVASLVSSGWLTTDERGHFGRSSTHRLTIPPLVTIGTGEVSAPVSRWEQPVSGSPVSRSDGATATRKRLTRARFSGSPVSHHLCQELRPWLASVGAA